MPPYAPKLLERADGIVAAAAAAGDLAGPTEAFARALAPFQEATGRGLVDAVLPDVVQRLCCALRTVLQRAGHQQHAHYVARALTALVAVRGWKQVAAQMPHGAEDFQDVFLALDAASEAPWQLRYALLLWMSTLALLPFDLKTVDSTDRTDMADQLVAIGVEALGDRGKTRDGAVCLLVKLLNRTDMSSHLFHFLQIVQDPNSHSASPHFRLGTLSCLAGILKHGDRKALKPLAHSMLPWLSQAQSSTIESTAESLLLIKVAQRLAMVLVPPSPAKWLYKSSISSLFGSDATSRKPKTAPVAHEPALTDDVLTFVEEVLETLLCGLKDRDTVVRWSAAKGVGRITGRLPFILARDIIESVLSLYYTCQEGEELVEATFHGVCLCLAELARRGLLLPGAGHLGAAVAVVTHCLRFDRRRGAHSVGSNVRDSACYTVWAFARAYSRADMHQYAQPLAAAVIPVILLDREINCRRAASAAFQECVGRLEEQTFPGGIEIVTKADFFNVSDRRHSYLDLAPNVSKVSNWSYAASIVNELVECKLSHWDKNIRALSAESLARILRQRPSTDGIDEIVSNLLARTMDKFNSANRHGALIGLAELVLVLEFEEENKKLVLSAPVHLAQSKLLQGESGEQTRAGCARLIECFGRVGWVSGRTLGPYMDIVLDLLASQTEHIQTAAVAAFGTLYECVISSIAEERNRVLQLFISTIRSRDKKSGNGYIRASAFLKPDSVVLAKELLAVVESGADGSSPEGRKEAVYAICDLGGTGLEHWDAYMAALSDYEIDIRGDVGSWSRGAAMECISRSLVRIRPNESVTKKLTGLVVTQLCERMERMRLIARDCLASIVKAFPNQTLEALLEKLPDQEIALPRHFYSKAVGFLSVAEYRSHALAGLVSSAGRNEPQANEAQKALNRAIEAVDGEKVGEDLLRLVDGDSHGDRLVTPCLRVLNSLFESRVLEGTLACRREWVDKLGHCLRGVATRNPLEMERTEPVVRCLSMIVGLQCAGEGRTRALEGFMFLLGHSRPRVREMAAEELYMRVVESGRLLFQEFEDEVGLVASQTERLLLENAWSTGGLTELRAVRNELCPLLQVQPPRNTRSSVAASTPVTMPPNRVPGISAV